MEQEKDALSAQMVAELQKRINDAAPRSLAAELDDWQKARDRYQELDAMRNRTPQQQAEYAGILRDLPKKITNIDSALKTLPENDVYSEPRFDPHKPLAPRYLFYKPIVYFVPADRSFYQGLVRLDVDTTDHNEADRGIHATASIRSTALIALAGHRAGNPRRGHHGQHHRHAHPEAGAGSGGDPRHGGQGGAEGPHHQRAHARRDRPTGRHGECHDAGAGGGRMREQELLLGKDVQKMFLPLEKDEDNRSSNTAGEENTRSSGDLRILRGRQGRLGGLLRLQEAR